MRRRNPPEGIWQPRPIPGMPERMRLAADFGCGLPTRADLKLFGLSREYERIGGRVQ